MIFLKSYFATTTKETDFIPIIHDIRFAIRDSQVVDGLATITIPGEEAGLLIAKEVPKEALGFDLRSLSLPVKNKELLLEPKQMIYLIDRSNSGKRREFVVQVFGETPPPPKQQRGRR